VTDLLATVIASALLVGVWLCIAGPIGALAHVRMRRVERDLGAPALPANELPLLLLAVASIAWPVATVVALVAWIKRPWARLGRNVTLVFLAQITASVLSVVGLALATSRSPPESTFEELFPLVVLACVNLGAGILVATPLLWVWAGRRAVRLRARPSTGPAPGLWRFALYALSLWFWPVGITLSVMLTEPQDAGVGANAFRWSLVQIAGVALAVCVAVPFAVKEIAARYA
jgi:hypothetical protein